MLTVTEKGLYCREGHFYIDPQQPVPTAIITHAHADHARFGMGTYIGTPPTCHLIQSRFNFQSEYIELDYFTPKQFGNVMVTLAPAGHILGSAQVIIDYKSKRTVITGDFKCGPDTTVKAFTPITCDLLVLESTFALPIYSWPCISEEFKAIRKFYSTNKNNAMHTVLYAYSLGKAQRLLAGLTDLHHVAVHPAIEKMNDIYIKYNYLNRQFPRLTPDLLATWNEPGLIIAPPATIGSSWIKKLKSYKEAYVSGWMLGKGQVRRRNMRGFVISDHADWNDLNNTIVQCCPKEVWTMHGYTDIFASYLKEKGYLASSLTQMQLERSE